ncbi:TPA: hypothetical protein DCX66_02725 [Candidatus Nomurabacteria bacterium]|uniref:Deoxyribonuclease I n=1 Tax=Candidatus Nomurabacteria bacterium GW2011_GWE1_35_16 TaxID=1618761 RepID=A0A0G0EE70_9BACT|nr:MAG: Deoxyribonuclease I [Candidatus Nomurabacteria bacterium GW2011_GWE1_35_16]HAE36920.1 hypothetical protein [Candidatus Nomurabacteria bacterium]HAX65362.1 hypothetical protein [Candidatus Nomurabacteria bacterium]HCU01549.1 hypothetical protein [Candidatus Nomurabacteria bacterium]
MDKIKGKIGIDSTTFLCLCIVVLVGLSSFGLGRLSATNTSEEDIKLENTNDYIVKEGAGKSIEAESSIDDVNSNFKEKKYLASKNGKLYYTVSCSGAKRISEKNKVWFATSEEAKKAGYSLSSSCK